MSDSTAKKAVKKRSTHGSPSAATKAAVARERERCAAIAAKWTEATHATSPVFQNGMRSAASAICVEITGSVIPSGGE